MLLNIIAPFTGLEDKASACDMLVCYARELKEAFAEYAEDVVKLMVPMLKFYFHDNVRTAAAESLPYLLECARIRGPQYIQGMWAYILPELLKAIDSEPEQDVQVELLNSLAKVSFILLIYSHVGYTCAREITVWLFSNVPYNTEECRALDDLCFHWLR